MRGGVGALGSESLEAWRLRVFRAQGFVGGGLRVSCVPASRLERVVEWKKRCLLPSSEHVSTIARAGVFHAMRNLQAKIPSNPLKWLAQIFIDGDCVPPSFFPYIRALRNQSELAVFAAPRISGV